MVIGYWKSREDGQSKNATFEGFLCKLVSI